MSTAVDWSNLPEELIDQIANRVFSNVELHRLRNICKSWRSAIATKKRFPNRNRKRNLSPYNGKDCDLSPASFFRVVLSSFPDKGWLIKTLDLSKFRRKKLLSPLSHHFINPSSHKTLDLLKFTVSEIHRSHEVEYEYASRTYSLGRVVLVDNFVFVVNNDKQILWCKNDQETSNDVWTRIEDEEVKLFLDIILHKGQIYALDLKGAIWWISLSKLNIFQYGPSTPLEYDEIDTCKDKRFVEYCGDLCVVHHFCERVRLRSVDIERTIGFKVYKMDDELVEWVEVKSLGDKAFVLATDCCFSVLAREYHGCLENSIYFTEEGEKGGNVIKVFKLGDRIGSITRMGDSFSSQSCFQMYFPPFA